MNFYSKNQIPNHKGSKIKFQIFKSQIPSAKLQKTNDKSQIKNKSQKTNSKSQIPVQRKVVIRGQKTNNNILDYKSKGVILGGANRIVSRTSYGVKNRSVLDTFA